MSENGFEQDSTVPLPPEVEAWILEEPDPDRREDLRNILAGLFEVVADGGVGAVMQPDGEVVLIEDNRLSEEEGSQDRRHCEAAAPQPDKSRVKPGG